MEKQDVIIVLENQSNFSTTKIKKQFTAVNIVKWKSYVGKFVSNGPITYKITDVT